MGAQIPPWLEEQLKSYQQTQNNLQAAMAQIQQLETERLDAERALDELQKAPDGVVAYKQTGSILVQTDRKTLMDDLDERLQLIKTRTTVLDRQKGKLAETLKGQEAKINAAMRGGATKPM